MKTKLFFLVMFLMLSISLSAQENIVIEIEEDSLQTKEKIEGDYVNVYRVVEKMPEFQGGIEALRAFITENTNYPKKLNECDIEGTVYVKFVVNKYGKVEQAQIARGVDPLLDAEALRIVNALPDFIPGTQGGKPVNVWYSVPIRFKLN